MISSISQDEENFGGHIRKVQCFGRSSVLTSLAVTQDEQYLLVGDCNENASKIHICCLDNLEEIRSISNISCPMGIAVTEERTVFVSSSKEHGLYCAQQDEIVLDTGALTLACGSTRPGHREGINSEWNMPSALCAYHNTVFVCDVGNKAVRILTSAKKLLPLQKEMAKYANVFRLDKVTFDKHLKHVQEVNFLFSEQEQQAFERTGKLNTNGPDMTVARCTHQSFQIVLDSLTSLSNTLTEIGMDHLLDSIRFESLTTFGVECFFKAMRADHDMPTVAGYAYKRACCVKDDMMHIYQKRFSYFMGPNYFYPEKIIKSDPPNMDTHATKQSVASKGSGNKDEDKLCQNVMREFVSEYGRGVRQENVRSKTKEITGTLPYTLSMRPAAITASNEVDDIVSECQCA